MKRLSHLSLGNLIFFPREYISIGACVLFNMYCIVNYPLLYISIKWNVWSLKPCYSSYQIEWLIWEQNDDAVIELIGGHGATIGFSMLKKQVPIIARLQEPENQAGLLNTSIHSLPLSEQSLFKGILLVPMGVLLVVFMRILIGLKTSGTFMPVLIALAFMQTSLVTGLIGFLLIA